MERGEEELQLLGVEEEAFNTLFCSSRRDLVGALAFTLLLPLAFATLVLCLMPGPLVLYKSNHEFFYMITKPVESVTLESRGSQRLPMANGVYEFWMLSTAAVMYTAASIHTANEVSFANSLTVVTRFWKPLAATLLWFFIVVLAHTTVYILAFILVMCSVGFDKYVNSREFLFSSFPILAFFFCVLVYINMIAYLGGVTSVLQEKYYSPAALRKRRRIIKEKRRTALSLFMVYFVSSQCAGLFWYAATELESLGGAWIVTRAVRATFLGGLLCLVMFWGLVIQTGL